MCACLCLRGGVCAHVPVYGGQRLPQALFLGGVHLFWGRISHWLGMDWLGKPGSQKVPGILEFWSLPLPPLFSFLLPFLPPPFTLVVFDFIYYLIFIFSVSRQFFSVALDVLKLSLLILFLSEFLELNSCPWVCIQGRQVDWAISVAQKWLFFEQSQTLTK